LFVKKRRHIKHTCCKSNADREDHGKKPFPPDKFEKEEVKEIKESTTDPESGYYVKDERTIYARRKETIERVFADAKEKHGMRWTTLRGLKKLSMQAMLTFVAMNLKKMANWTWVSPNLA
jgi:hypothetical protein